LVESIKVPFELKGPFRITETKAHEVLRECLVNMLAHADYAESSVLLIKPASNGFFFRNPGTSRIPEDDLLCGDRSDPRNPILMKMFRNISLAEESGQGFPEIIQVWREAGLQLPMVQSDSERYEFSLTLRLVHLIARHDREWLTWCAQHHSPEGGPTLPGITTLTDKEQMTLLLALRQGMISNASVQGQTGLHPADVTDLLSSLRKRGLLQQCSSRRWATYELPEDARREHDIRFSAETYKEKPIKKTHREKRVSVEARIVMMCSSPKAASEIAETLPMNRMYLIHAYLTPMVREGKLNYTDPSNPTSKKQQYVRKND